MKVTYIGHSGFLTETETVCLLFDYWNGEIPEIPEELPLYVFVSHRHEDHYNREIFSLAERKAEVTYLLSFDIPKEEVPETVKEKTYFMDPDASRIIGDLEVKALESTDEGVAFLVRIPGEDRLIYHAGDLNWWVWDGEPEEENEHYTVWFHAQVEKLAALVREKGRNGRLDLAFFTMDPRQEIYEFYGTDWQLQNVPVDVVFPMHCSEDYEIIDRYLELRGEAVEELLPVTEQYNGHAAGGKGPVIRLAHIRKRGEKFEIQNDSRKFQCT